MLGELPVRALLRFELEIPQMRTTPTVDGDMRKWTRRHMIPPLFELEDEQAFADAYWAWNEDGLYFAFDMPFHKGRAECDPTHWWKKDGFRICIDTRDARENRRGTRFCHFFYLLPAGGGKGRDPIVGLHRMSRAKAAPPNIDTSKIRIATRSGRTGYSIEMAIPGVCLHGWDPVEHPRIGFFYKAKDVKLGTQNLTVDDNLGWNVDPSTWATAVLVK